jgi:hypothetical protein
MVTNFAIGTLAHTDLLLATGGPATPLAATSRAAIREAIDAITDVIREISVFFDNADLYFNHQGFDALELLHLINDGLCTALERDERIRSGKARPDDYQPVDL